MRKELDLFANVRPVKVPSEGIDWTFSGKHRRLVCTGVQGIHINDDIAMDFA